MIMIVGFSEIPPYSAIRTGTQLAQIKEYWVLTYYKSMMILTDDT